MYKIIEINAQADLKKFVNFPGKYIFEKSDPWVPPLTTEELKRFQTSKNHFYSYGKSKLFAAIDAKGNWVGRIACFINTKFIDKTQKRQGFFGFFDSIDNPDVIRLLIEAVKNEFIKNEIFEIIGPINFSTNEEAGLLVEGFDIAPTFMTNFSKPYYGKLLESNGFQKLVDLYAYEWYEDYVFPDSFYRLVSALKNKSKLNIRCFDKNKFEQEIERLWPLYNNSFKDVWGFTPLSKTEFDELCYSFKLFADFDMILIAELNGAPVGLCLALPDINILIKKINGKLFPFGIIRLLTQKSKIKNLRLNVLAIKPEFRNLGVAPLFIDRLVATALNKGYKKAELSLVLESNKEMTRLMQSLDFRPTKTFRIYSLNLKPNES